MTRFPGVRHQRQAESIRIAGVHRIRELEQLWKAACEGSGLCQWIDTPSGWIAAVPVVGEIVLGDPTAMIVELRPGQIPEDIERLSRRLSFALGCAALGVTVAEGMWVRVELLDSDGSTDDIDLDRTAGCQESNTTMTVPTLLGRNGKR